MAKKNGIDTLYIYKKAGNLEEIQGIAVNPKYYEKEVKKDIAIGFKINLLKTIPIAKCPLVLAMIKSNIRLTMGTFKSIEDPNNPDSHKNSYFGNKKALEYVLSNKKVKVENFTEYLECLAPVEFETLIAKIMEEQGYFVPAYKGGMLKDYDLICKKNDNQINLQIKLNLSKETYSKYKKKDLQIWCITKSEKIEDGKMKIFDSFDIHEILKNLPVTKEWLKKSLDWIDFDF